VQDAIRSELGDQRIRVAQIEPAGEKGVLFANITNELKHFNGRCGLGAVMGSKNLRAIAVRGKLKPQYANPDRIKELAKKGAAKIATEGFYKDWKRLGTDMNVTWNTDIGGLPTRNWTMGTFPEREKISEHVYADEWMAVVDKANFLRQRENYYRLNGWDPVTGNPIEVKLSELGLDWAWEAMQSR
jgi:aldehyde:ferredoxin oxidoreductase